jgi:hypothetical protein
VTNCHDNHGFKWKNTNVFLISIGFVSDLKPFCDYNFCAKTNFINWLNVNYVMEIGQIWSIEKATHLSASLTHILWGKNPTKND